MKTIIIVILGILSLNLQAQVKPAYKVKWDNGYKFQSADKNFKLKFGGRIMWDNEFFFQSKSIEKTFGELKNGSEFRRVRFYNAGEIYQNVKYKLQLDFAGGKITFKDVFMELKDLPVVGSVRAGHFKEPIGLEGLTSSKYITFLERSFPIDMNPGRNMGIMLKNSIANHKVSWQLGAFRQSDGAAKVQRNDNAYDITGRITGLPYINKERNQLLHIGLAYSRRNLNSEDYKITARPEAHLGLKYISTGVIKDVSKIDLINAELALVLNSFSFQGELTQSHIFINNESSTDYSFMGYYAQVSYFLTGESRKYKNSFSGFSRTKPKSNFGGNNHGLGAWEVALRYSSIDLNNENINGGSQSDITLGINWYLNPSARIMANYVLAKVSSIGNSSIVQFRFQIDF